MTWPMWDLGLSSHKLPVRFVWCLCHLFGHVANMKLSVGETHWWLKKGINLIPLAVLATGQFVGLTGKNNVFPFSNWILSSSKRSALTWVLAEPQLKRFKIFSLLQCLLHKVSDNQVFPSFYAKTWALGLSVDKASWRLLDFHVEFWSFFRRMEWMF